MPKTFGQWSSIYQRFRRWMDNGVFDRIENELKSQSLEMKGIQSLVLDSTDIKVHPDGTGTLKKWAAIARQKPRRPHTKIHLIVANETTPIVRRLSSGSAADNFKDRWEC